MSAIALTQFLIDITRGHRQREFAAEPERVLADSPLDETLRQAIREQDVGALWLAGAHPMALMYFARSRGWANDRYYACLEAAELRRAERAAAAPQPDREPPRTHRSSAPHAR